MYVYEHVNKNLFGASIVPRSIYAKISLLETTKLECDENAEKQEMRNGLEILKRMISNKTA